MKNLLLGCCMLIAAYAQSQQLVLKLIHPQINGDRITYDVVSDSLVNLLTMQYGISYDSSRLQFITTKNYNLPGLSASNFNVPFPGAFLSVWFESSLIPVSLSHGTVLYQIEFEMLAPEPGNLCFSDEVLEYEFMNSIEEIAIFSIVDDCNPDPLPIRLTTAVEDITAEQLGLHVTTLIDQQQHVHFTIDRPVALAIQLFDMNGNLVFTHPTADYAAGANSVAVGKKLLPGMYLFATSIDDQHLRVKLISQ
jgi:hypothetical protein